jgi:nitrogenase molybdenum-iron protein NifN
MVSPADLRELKRLVAAFDLPLTLLPDYSDTLDGPSWADYEKLPAGGTPVEAIRALGEARAALEFGRVIGRRHAYRRYVPEGDARGAAFSPGAADRFARD